MIRPYNKLLLLLFFGTFVTLVIATTFNPTHATPEASIMLGSNTIPEGIDFATRQLGMPWDMNSNPYPDFVTALKNVDRSSFEVENGIWNLTASSSDVKYWLHWSGIENTQDTLKMGENYPIDSTTYKLLSFYMCSDSASRANVYWFYTGSPWTNYGISKYITVDSGCKLYTMDLSTIDTFQGSWENNPIGFRLDPVSDMATFQFDWARLTSIDTHNYLPISWSNLDQTSTIHFYLSKTGCDSNGIPIGIGSGTTSGVFNWGQTLQGNPSLDTPYPIPASFEPGNYYVYAKENNTGSAICANQTLEIHKAPILTFQKPSYLSGPDYATVEAENSWGMASSEDIIMTRGIDSHDFTNGIFNGEVVKSDSQLHMNVPKPIDSSKYKYASFRFKVDGSNNPGTGRMQRFVWWYQGPTIDPVTTGELMLYEGWHTYMLVLPEAQIERTGDWSGNPTAFRFDPTELSLPAEIHLDFLTLTGDEIISSGDIFDIFFEPITKPGYEVKFYYDTDNKIGNGRTRIPSSFVSATSQTLDKNIYLPLVITTPSLIEPPEISLLTGEHFAWNTTGVPAGTYYISADIDDGVMTTTWYSELPIIITD